MGTAKSGPVNLHDQVAIVVGGARGIGQATGVALAREGAAVVVCDVLPTAETAGVIRQRGGTALEVRCDIRDKTAVEGAVEATMGRFGRIDILVICAAILEKDSSVSVEEVLEKEWHDIYSVNVWGTFNFCQAVWPVMKKQQYGKIICFGSVAAKAGALKSGIAYSSSKGAVHALVKTLAKRGAPLGICVNGVAPAFVQTPQTRELDLRAGDVLIGRLGYPEDQAEAVVFLASQASNFITGLILDVNGGMFLGS